jgi:MYXO-CTERM domain-containing protein
MDLSKFTRDELILGSLALLLAIDLLFLPWFEVSVGIGNITLSASSTTTGSPDGWLGVLGVLGVFARRLAV